jgi:hypothetical protein
MAISLRLLFSAALSRLLRITSLLFFPGILFLVLFFSRSYEAGKFTGNLYLGFSGLTLTAFSFVSFFFYLISAKIDDLQNRQLLTYNLIKPSQKTCTYCKSKKKGF